MHKLVVAALAAVILSGCAVKYTPYYPDNEVVDFPPIGQVATAGVGDKLLVKGVRVAGLALDLERPINGFLYDVQYGIYRKLGDKNEQQFFDGKGITKKGLGDPPQMLAVKSQNADQVCVVTVYGGYVCYDAEFKITSTSYEKKAAFQQTILYNGRFGDKIRIGYREFSNDVARPAFSNEVEYDLSTSNVIGYSGAQLEVIEANNTHITYKVISTFN